MQPINNILPIELWTQLNDKANDMSACYTRKQYSYDGNVELVTHKTVCRRS